MEKTALLVHPRLPERTYPGKPMGLDYLAAVLGQEEWRVRIVDLDLEPEATLVTTLQRDMPALVGITAMSVQADETARLGRRIRDLSPECILLRGGPHDSAGCEVTLGLHGDIFDAIGVGCGEAAMRRIAHLGVSRAKFLEQREGIPGLAFSEAGRVTRTGRGADEDIDECLPRRIRHSRSYDFPVFDGRKTAQVLTARGCEDSCFYCSEAGGDRPAHEQRRQLDSVRREFCELRRQGYQAIYFDDPTFARDKAWAIAMCALLREYGFTWGCNTRVETLCEDLVPQLRKSGCAYLFCGFESASPEVLRALNKTHDPGNYLAAAVRAYDLLGRSRIPRSAFLIFGAPRMEHLSAGTRFAPETDGDVRQSLEFAIERLDPEYLSMNVLRFLPGVPASYAPQFACVRPGERSGIHAGHYESAWYRSVGAEDLRSTHPILRAFEGCGSVSPVQMTPARCYMILSMAVDMVNAKNALPGRTQTRIVTDPRFGRYLQARMVKSCLRWALSPLEEIGQSWRDPTDTATRSAGRQVFLHLAE